MINGLTYQFVIFYVTGPRKGISYLVKPLERLEPRLIKYLLAESLESIHLRLFSF